MDHDLELAERFHARFSGLDRVHGETRLLPGKDARGKQNSSSGLVHEPVTVKLWQRHLAGELGIGIVPITDEGTCRWGALDLDQYQGELDNIADEVARFQLPLIACRTKSGGVHLYLFMSEATPAELVRTRLMEWAVVLGQAGVETYPKQIRLANKSDVGNWINMPYQDAEETARYAMAPKGKRLDADDFLDFAEAMEMSVEELRTFEVPKDLTFGDLLDEAPPCLQCLAQRGFGEGGRNNALYNIAVYLRKRYGENDFAHRLDEYNQLYMQPPLGHKEVTAVARSTGRKTYQYKCSDLPIVDVCNKQICLTRQFGVGGDDSDDPGVVFGGLVKIDTDPPVWIWDVDGHRIQLTTAELRDQGRFQTRCMERLNKWPRAIKPKEWAVLVREKLETLEIVEAPPEASKEGQVWDVLETFCTGNLRARSRDELLMDKPWIHDGRVYFRMRAALRYFESQHIKLMGPELKAVLHTRGLDHHFFNLKGRGCNVWSLPAFAEQTEEFSVPGVDDTSDM